MVNVSYCSSVPRSLCESHNEVSKKYYEVNSLLLLLLLPLCLANTRVPGVPGRRREIDGVNKHIYIACATRGVPPKATAHTEALANAIAGAAARAFAASLLELRWGAVTDGDVPLSHEVESAHPHADMGDPGRHCCANWAALCTRTSCAVRPWKNGARAQHGTR